MQEPQREIAGSGQESVWDYPRPPRVEDSARHIQVVFNGVTIADTHRSKRVLETSHPPTYYIPREDVRMEYLTPARRRTVCEWKGSARYYTITVGDRTAENAGWSYPEPTPAYRTLTDYIAVYPALMDVCLVDGEQVSAQPGDFYGGWITHDIAGPFKGGPGSAGW